MAFLYYQRLPANDAAHPNMPSSPKWKWRVGGKDVRRRPPQFRRAAFVVVSLIFAVSLYFFYQTRENAPGVQVLDILTQSEEPLQARPAPGNSHGRKPHHAHIPQPLTVAAETPETAQAPVSNASLPQATYDPITFSLIMFSESSAAEGAILMKSIIMYSSSPLGFHIICDQAAHEYLEKRLSLLKHPQHDILVRFYRIPQEDMINRIQREGALHSDHSAGVPGLMKLFIHEILPPTIERAIFIDTDAFFISDATQLWAHFNALQPGVAISMPSHPEQFAPDWHHANRICSCIMLLDLARLRELRLMDSSHYRGDSQHVPALAPPAFEAMFGKPVPDGDSGRMKYNGVKLGDQGYWWAIVSHRPEIFEHLSYDWEVSSCLMDMYYTGLGDDDADEETERHRQIHTHNDAARARIVLPKMLHFNCLEGVDRYYEWSGWSEPDNDLARRWLPAVRYHVGFKWLWLNQPASNATLSMETLFDVKFADELFAESRTASDDPEQH